MVWAGPEDEHPGLYTAPGLAPEMQFPTGKRGERLAQRLRACSAQDTGPRPCTLEPCPPPGSSVHRGLTLSRILALPGSSLFRVPAGGFPGQPSGLAVLPPSPGEETPPPAASSRDSALL